MAFAIVLILIVVASVVFHFLSPWWFTPVASNWGGVDDTINITFVVTGIAFVAINLFIAYAIVRYRHREGRRAAYEPESKKLEWWLSGLTTVGVCAMLAPGLFVYNDLIHPPKDAMIVEVLAQQWQWRYRFPGKDGKLGLTDPQFIRADDPFGMNPADPNGRDDVLIDGPELHLPLNKPVKILQRSRDVLHTFYVPQFRVKTDVVPGMVSYFWLTPTRAGRFEALCSQFCGVGHFNMRGHVVVEEEGGFQAWLNAKPTFAQLSAGGGDTVADTLSNQGKQLAQTQACVACHSLDGSASVGPTWKGLYGKSETLADGRSVVADEDYLKESILDPLAKVVKGYPPVMPKASLSEQQVAALVAYIKAASGKGEADAGQPSKASQSDASGK